MSTKYGFSGAYCDKCGRKIDTIDAVCNCQWQDVQTTKKQGWECPKCNRVFAPWVYECWHCSPKRLRDSGWIPLSTANSIGSSDSNKIRHGNQYQSH